MYYSIRHLTKFRYHQPVSESVMEARMQPRSEGTQRCLEFELRTTPRAVIGSYLDAGRNRVHYFDVPDRHSALTIRAEALVEAGTPAPPPDQLPFEAWGALDDLTRSDEYWDVLVPSRFTQPTELLQALARELRVERRADPLTTLRELNAALHDAFSYDQNSTDVYSPIDDALTSRQGVCQDFAHIMIALIRGLGIPCRYVSGYLYHRSQDHDRSARDATHAWVEALFPELGWVGFDPTNNLLAGERHIRVAVGRDYADVPPTRGVFKGQTDTELAVSVHVSPSDAPPQKSSLEDEAEPANYRAGLTDRFPSGEHHEQPQQ